MDIKPVRRGGVPDDITNRIMTLIKEKQLRPGEKLPSEREMVAQLQVSRPSLREAMRALAFMNVIEIRQGDGTYVSSLEPELLIEQLDFVFSVDDSTYPQLLQARQLLEPNIAALAAKHITDAEITDIEAVLEQAIANVDDVAVYVDLDILFHRRIADASRNTLLVRFMASIAYLDKMGRIASINANIERDRDAIMREVFSDHHAIIKSLQTHDAEAAHQAMENHLLHVEQTYVRGQQHLLHGKG